MGRYGFSFEAHGTDERTEMRTVTERFDYRPAPAAATVAAHGSLFGVDGWIGAMPSCGMEYFP